MVVTVTTAFCVRGYCRTGRSPIERKPSTKIVRLTTVASTGRSMKMSVNFLICAPRSLVLGLRRRLVRRLDRIVDDHGHPRAQLDLSGGDHRVAFLDAREDCDLVAARAADRNELLLSEERCLPVLALLLLHDEHGVAVGIVGDCRLRQRDEALRSARGDGNRGEHPGRSLRFGLRTVPRTWTFRVAGSTFGSIELISPGNCSPANASVLSTILCFSTIFPSDFCGA